MSFFVLIGLTWGLHLYIGARLVPHLPQAAGIALVVVLVACALLMPAALVARRSVRGPAGDRLTWAGMLLMGFFSSLLVATFLRDALLLVLWIADRWASDVPWPQVLSWSAIAVPLLALGATLVGLVNARSTARVVEVKVPLAQLAPAWDDFRIVQISDIHVGPTIKDRYLDAVVDAVNALQPDAIAITGDLVDGSVADLAPHVAPLARLKARHGVYFVTGNHEYYSGVHGWVAELRRLGIRVLNNEHVVLQREAHQLVLAGVTDYSAGHFDPTHRSDPAAAIAGAPSSAVKVLLAHQPRSAAAAAAAGFDLQLSGHTHGGQFLPWGFFVRFQQPFTAGLHKLDRLWVYTSRGTGYWGPPKRLGAPSEITHIRLTVSA